MRLCENCGNYISEELLYCSVCGKKLPYINSLVHTANGPRHEIPPGERPFMPGYTQQQGVNTVKPSRKEFSGAQKQAQPVAQQLPDPAKVEDPFDFHGYDIKRQVLTEGKDVITTHTASGRKLQYLRPKVNKKQAVIFGVIAAVLLILFIATRVPPSKRYLIRHMPEDIYAYDLNGERIVPEIKSMTVKDADYHIGGGRYRVELVTEDEYMTRQLSVRLEVRGFLGFWYVKSFRFTDEYDRITFKEAFFEFILGEYDLKKEDLVTNHSDYTMADTRGIIDIEVREGRIEGTFYQKSSYRLGRFYDFDLVYQKED